MPRARFRLDSRRKKKKPRTKQPSSDAGDWYIIRRILDEKVTHGQVAYLVEWEDNTQTGEVYEPTWSVEVTDQARAEWEAKKTADQARRSITPAEVEQEDDQGQKDDEEQEKATAESQDEEEQEPRPANWRQLKRTQSRQDLNSDSDNNSESEWRPAKRIRTIRTASPSVEPTPSFTEASSPESGRENLVETQGQANGPGIQIQLEPSRGFDPAAYLSVNNTQVTSDESQSIAELEEADRRILLYSQSTQGTEPKSQETSQETANDDSQSQGATGAHAGLAANALAISDALEIPDSQEQSNQLQHSTESASTNPQIVFDSSPQRPFVTNSQAAESDIPSHQPNFSAQSGNLAPQSSHSSLHSSSARRPISDALDAIAASATRYASQQSYQRPEFQSQAPFSSHHSPARSVSSTQSTSTVTLQDFSLRPLRAGAAPTEVARLRESQPAQAFARNSHSVSSASRTHISESHNSQNLSSEIPPAAASRPASWQRQSRPQVTPPRRSAFFDQVLCSPIEESHNMDAEKPSSSSGRRSMVDEFYQVIDDSLSDMVPPQSAPAESQTLAAEIIPPSHPQPDLASAPEPSSHSLVFESQPVDQPLPPWIPEVTINKSDPAVEAIKTSAVSEQGASAAPAESSWPSGDLHPALVVAESQPEPVQSISPAEILKQPDVEEADLSPVPSALPVEMFGPSAVSMSLGHEADPLGLETSPIDSPAHTTAKEHLVTLPFQASMRSLYDETLLEYRQEIKSFSQVFASETWVEPEPHLVSKVDQLLGRLYNLCDYPNDAIGTDLEALPPAQLAKYSCDANAKFNFIYELLHGLEKSTEVLIYAGSKELLRLLHHVTTLLEIDCNCKELGISKGTNLTSVVQVTLSTTDYGADPSDYDIVVGFDHSFSGSPMANQLSSQGAEEKSPFVLVLVTTHSIEHIEHHLPMGEGLLERKNALLAGIVNSRRILGDPDPSLFEPYKVAQTFYEYLNGETRSIAWEATPIPEEVMDIYLSQAPHTQTAELPEDVDYSRKRKLDDSDDEDVKRMRILPLDKTALENFDPPAPDAVRQLLDGVGIDPAAGDSRRATLKVPITTLEALAEKVAELERRRDRSDLDAEAKEVIERQEKELKDYRRSQNKMYNKMRSATEDRTTFETAKSLAEAVLGKERSSRQQDKAKDQSKIAELEARFAGPPAEPKTAEGEQSVPTPDPLKAAEEKIQLLEKRLTYARQETEYARDQYQKASAAASESGSEVVQLREQVGELQKKASENLVLIHQIQADSNTRAYQQQIRDLKAQVKERESELDRARDELRQLRNGRRDTRQSSAPRSPRMGVMSPRTGRIYAGGSASRGTSPNPASGVDTPNTMPPLPGMQFLTQQTGNGRWNHLRD